MKRQRNINSVTENSYQIKTEAETVRVNKYPGELVAETETWRTDRSCGGRTGVASLLLCLIVLLSGVGCGGDMTETKDFDDDGGVAKANVTKGVKPEADREAAVVETEFGMIVIELYPNLAPKMVGRFKKLVGEGFYNGTAFHRVDPRTGVIQGGDPNSLNNDPFDDGMGGSDEPDLPAEFSDVPFERGVVGAARARDVDSANCQFYITLRRVAMWDQQYTVFGRVISGMNDADIISSAPVREGTENPDPPVIIKRITLQPRSKF